MRSNAVLCTRSAKKMLTLVDEAVKELILKKNGTEYGYPSGKNKTDFIDFVLYRMYHQNKFNGASGDIDAPVDESRDTENPQDVLAEPTDEFVAKKRGRPTFCLSRTVINKIIDYL